MTATKKNISRGEFIFREGETGGFAYILNEGVVEIIKASDEGTIVLSEVPPGAIFGEMAIIDGGARSAGARARSDAIVTEVDGQSFRDYIAKNPETALSLMKRLSGYVRSTNIRSAEDLLEMPDQKAVKSGAKLPRSRRIPNAMSDMIEDTDAVYDARPALPLMLVSGVVLAFIAAIVVFVSFTFVDTTVSARGKFTTEVPNVEVQATSNAVIEALVVQRGQPVAQGEVVASLDGTYVNANLKVVQEKFSAVNQRINRLHAELTLINSTDAVPWDLNLTATNLDILTKRVEEYRSRMSAFAASLSKLDLEIASVEANIKTSEAQLDSKKRIEEVRKKMYDEQIGSLLSYLEAQDSRLSAVQRHSKAIDTHNKLKTERLVAIAERQAFVAKWSADLSDKLAKEEEAHIQLSEELVKLERQSQDLLIVSPINGIVLDLPSVSEGSIVSEGESILTLVRTNVPITLEIDIETKDVSDMKIGTPVSIKLDALPFQQFGDIDGTLVFMSDDTFPESLQGEKGAFYRGRVEIEGNSLSDLPDGFRLTPGMLASADLKVGERRLVTYFTYPITKNFSEAFREPD